MKKVVSGEELQEKLSEAINLLCDTVKVTLGPKGSNIIIDHSTFSPFITNDGVTIAENIESEDPVINTILELAKEASIKTNENVGDGTTTTLVLLQSIFNNGLKLINNGINPIILKKELDNKLPEIIKKIQNKSRLARDEEVLNLVSISGNDKKIGKIISDAYFKLKSTDGIKISEGKLTETIVEYLKGYTFDTSLASPYYFLDKLEITLNDAKMLLIENCLNDIEDIEIIIKNIIEENRDLVIIAKDYGDDLVNEIIAINLEIKPKIYLIESSLYGNREKYFYDDLKDITNSNIVKDTNNINLNDLGNILNMKINKEYSNIDFKENDIIKEKIKNILKNIEEDIEFNNKRISMLKSGIINILVGASTATERREKKMRYDDALCALKTIKDGVLPGSGIVLYEISEKLDNSIGNTILKEALKEPFYTIMNNSGIAKEEIIKNIKNSNYTKIYNVNKNKYEDIVNSEVIDSSNVVINSLTNAISIAGMLLTTSSLIINEYQNNLNKENIYNEM